MGTVYVSIFRSYATLLSHASYLPEINGARTAFWLPPSSAQCVRRWSGPMAHWGATPSIKIVRTDG
jgi:hypothetical protein